MKRALCNTSHCEDVCLEAPKKRKKSPISYAMIYDFTWWLGELPKAKFLELWNSIIPPQKDWSHYHPREGEIAVINTVLRKSWIAKETFEGLVTPGTKDKSLYIFEFLKKWFAIFEGGYLEETETVVGESLIDLLKRVYCDPPSDTGVALRTAAVSSVENFIPPSAPAPAQEIFDFQDTRALRLGMEKSFRKFSNMRPHLENIQGLFEATKEGCLPEKTLFSLDDFEADQQILDNMLESMGDVSALLYSTTNTPRDSRIHIYNEGGVEVQRSTNLYEIFFRVRPSTMNQFTLSPGEKYIYMWRNGSIGPFHCLGIPDEVEEGEKTYTTGPNAGETHKGYYLRWNRNPFMFQFPHHPRNLVLKFEKYKQSTLEVLGVVPPRGSNMMGGYLEISDFR